MELQNINNDTALAESRRVEVMSRKEKLYEDAFVSAIKSSKALAMAS